MKDLLIIYYHEIVGENEGYSYQKMEVNKFEKQMEYLSANGYQTIFFSQIENNLPNKTVIVSFDDGFRTVYQNAAPIMRRYGIKGNIYLPTHYIGLDEHFMTWPMVKELYDSGAFEMQAHTHNHLDIRNLSENDMREEIEKSNNLFKEYLGYVPKTFCMPFGVYDKRSINTLKSIEAYKYYLGSFYGRCVPEKLGNKILPRIGVSNDDTMEVFADKLNGKYDWKGPLQRLRLTINNLRKERITKYEY